MASGKKTVFRSLIGRFGRETTADREEAELLEYLVLTIEPKLKGVRGYRKRLREPLHRCRAHCKAAVAEIPGPVSMKTPGYRSDPVLRAAFAGTDTIEGLLKRADSRMPPGQLDQKDRFAFLTMTSREKVIFGSKRQGDMILGDVAMRTVTFTDHNLVGLGSTLEESKKGLERYCLEIIAEAAARHLSEIRTNLVDLRQRQQRLRAMNKMFGEDTSSGMGCVFVPFDPDSEKKKKQLQQMLIENEGEIAAAGRNCQTPEDWLGIIEEFLLKPEDILSMRLVTLRLNWCNVLTDDPAEKADAVSFATFTLADEMQREGVLVAYDMP